MSLRRLFDGVECPRFGDEPCDPVPVTIKSAPVTSNPPAVTNNPRPKRGRPASQSTDERKAKAAAKVAEWRKRQKAE